MKDIIIKRIPIKYKNYEWHWVNLLESGCYSCELSPCNKIKDENFYCPGIMYGYYVKIK